jgi:hypothetical protein
MAWAWHGKCESDTAALSKSNGKDSLNTYRHGMGTACYVWIGLKCLIRCSVRSPVCRTLISISIPPLRHVTVLNYIITYRDNLILRNIKFDMLFYRVYMKQVKPSLPPPTFRGIDYTAFYSTTAQLTTIKLFHFPMCHFHVSASTWSSSGRLPTKE